MILLYLSPLAFFVWHNLACRYILWLGAAHLPDGSVLRLKLRKQACCDPPARHGHGRFITLCIVQALRNQWELPRHHHQRPTNSRTQTPDRKKVANHTYSQQDDGQARQGRARISGLSVASTTSLPFDDGHLMAQDGNSANDCARAPLGSACIWWFVDAMTVHIIPPL
jgi:hypothetical protein